MQGYWSHYLINWWEFHRILSWLENQEKTVYISLYSFCTFAKGMLLNLHPSHLWSFVLHHTNKIDPVVSHLKNWKTSSPPASFSLFSLMLCNKIINMFLHVGLCNSSLKVEQEKAYLQPHAKGKKYCPEIWLYHTHCFVLWKSHLKITD